MGRNKEGQEGGGSNEGGGQTEADGVSGAGRGQGRWAQETSQRDQILPLLRCRLVSKHPPDRPQLPRPLTCFGPASSGSSLHWK